MNFQIHSCPLCNQSLQLSQLAKVQIYSCPQNHYQVESDETESIQHFYLLHFAIDNYQSTNKARIYKKCNNKWKFLTQTPHVQPSPNLLPFLQELDGN